MVGDHKQSLQVVRHGRAQVRYCASSMKPWRFLQEFQALETQNANFKLIATMTEIEKSACPWRGEVGMIDHKMLDRHLKAWYSAGPICYIAGPPQMVRDLQTMLTKAGVDSDDIRTEEFSGY